MEVERDRRKVVQRMKFEGVRYIAPGPPDMEHVIMALASFTSWVASKATCSPRCLRPMNALMISLISSFMID